MRRLGFACVRQVGATSIFALSASLMFGFGQLLCAAKARRSRVSFATASLVSGFVTLEDGAVVTLL